MCAFSACFDLRILSRPPFRRRMMNPEFPNLSKLLGSYSHQDCFEYAPTVEGIIGRYKDDESSQAVRSAAAELGKLLALQWPESKLLLLIEEEGCALDPRVSFGSCRDWLMYLKSLLDEDARVGNR